MHCEEAQKEPQGGSVQGEELVAWEQPLQDALAGPGHIPERKDRAGIQPRRFLPSYASFLGAVSASWAQRFRGAASPPLCGGAVLESGEEGKGRVSARTFPLGSGKPAIFKIQAEHPQVPSTVPTTPKPGLRLQELFA